MHTFSIRLSLRDLHRFDAICVQEDRSRAKTLKHMVDRWFETHIVHWVDPYDEPAIMPPDPEKPAPHVIPPPEPVRDLYYEALAANYPPVPPNYDSMTDQERDDYADAWYAERAAASQNT